ncbi:Inorganic pyrophosphatase [Streptomyces sp. RB17]|uniref:inorganic diphosphatase n=1 Tax=Streptomyces sp. RB17 TaxID=2585197 RepID=UPI0012971F42|nr:inorganic diphosphatase [Streptomyces sp. RB17]MQY33999.1 Inorganic pyrophosphatase [Streptomyces sp. RB17]
MPRITVDIDATASSTIRTSDDGASGRLTSTGWPVGHGRIPDTLDDAGLPLDALVLMAEPALAGTTVPAWPLGVLHRIGAQAVPVAPVLLCVAEDPSFIGLVDTDDLPRWHAEGDAWAAVLARLRHQAVDQVTDCGSRAEAEHLISDAHHAYERLTGCLE